MEMQLPKRYLKIDEAAMYLNVSKKTIYRLVASRSIPFNHVGPTDTLRFDMKALDKWMERQLIPASPRLPADC